MLDRVISENNTLEDVLTRPVDYDSTNRLIEEARKASVSYLKDVICEVCGNE